MTLVQSVLADFFTYTARYWTILLVLVALHLFCRRRATKGGRCRTLIPEYWNRFSVRALPLEDDIFQGRSRAEFVLSKTGEAICVHVHWRNKPPGAAQVEEIALARRKLHCRYAIIISRGGFTSGRTPAGCRPGSGAVGYAPVGAAFTSLFCQPGRSCGGQAWVNGPTAGDRRPRFCCSPRPMAMV